MAKWGSIFLFVFFFFGVGGLITWSSKKAPDQYVDNSGPRSRDPAAIRKSYDFSDLEGMALNQATKQRLLAGVKLYKETNQVGIELGHFVMRGDGQSKTFACDKFERVVLEFEGDGMAMAGEKPTMQVEGACAISADINRISPLWIPVAKILGEPVAEGEFDFREGNPIKVRFANVSDSWPAAWVLKGVKLEASTGESLRIDGSDLRQMIPKPVVVEFK